MAVVLLFLTYGIFLAHKINLVTADLGRHLRNGELLFQNPAVLFRNFYSYTQPDFPVINHHWGSGLIFWNIFRFGGFPALSLFNLFLSLATFFIFFKLAKKASGVGLATLVSLPLIPLLAERTEIRPEIFSYFFSGVFFFFLSSQKYLWLLPLLQVLWVNLHIYFFLGPLLVGIFLVSKKSRQLAYVFLLTTAACLVNPFGLKGALSPLTIFENYGYRLVENQPVWFIEKLIRNPNFAIFKINFGILLASFVLAFWRKKPVSLVNLFLALFFSALAWRAIRNFTIFALFTLPIISDNLQNVLPKRSEINQALILISTVLLVFAFPLVAFGLLPSFFPYWHEPGFGLEKENSAAAEFFKKEKIKGPIFNNYDIGGYLIFHLFPEEKVFVDNRPEAYPKEFFEKVYIPMQESEEEWKKQEEKYQFNAIFFSRLDATPWGQKFLISRVKDPSWAPVFVDRYTIIFLKRNQQNSQIIKTHEIPKEE
ncbi:MAG: hypothetical protein ACPLXP_02255 [Microgenomates group bacterium]